MKRIFFFTIIYFLFAKQAFAQSSYVLPYPSAMPGNILYKVNLVKESLLKFWYFGDFGQFKYNLKESDKYLVEAKTLLEYDQFLLAYNSLQKSNEYFDKISSHLLSAKKNGKNIDQDRNILKEASLKHIEVLSKILKEISSTIVWRPEKQKPITLNFKNLINQSISIRAKYL